MLVCTYSAHFLRFQAFRPFYHLANLEESRTDDQPTASVFASVKDKMLVVDFDGKDFGDICSERHSQYAFSLHCEAVLLLYSIYWQRLMLSYIINWKLFLATPVGGHHDKIDPKYFCRQMPVHLETMKLALLLLTISVCLMVDFVSSRAAVGHGCVRGCLMGKIQARNKTFLRKQLWARFRQGINTHLSKHSWARFRQGIKPF